MTPLIDPQVWLANLADGSLKGLPILALAWLATLALRRSSASSRHLAWTLAAVGLVALPGLSALSPDRTWTPSRSLPATVLTSPNATDVPGQRKALPGPVAPATEDPGPIAGPPSPPIGRAEPPRPVAAPVPAAAVAPGRPRAGWLVLAWAVGALATLGPWLMGVSAAWWRGLRAPRVASGPWFEEAQAIRSAYGIRRRVDLRLGPEGAIPATWGFVRPVVLLPVDAQGWSPEALRAVLRHELAHARRGDFQPWMSVGWTP